MTDRSDKIVFHVSSRNEKGSNKVSRLRKEGRIPGNIYGLGKKSLAIVTDYQGLKNLYFSQGDTGLIYLQLDDDKKQIPVLIDNVEFVKIGEGILHVSFKRVSLDIKIQAEVPVIVVGEAKIDEAVVSLIKDTVLVEALPANLPEKFELDISSLTEVGQSITLADLKFNKQEVSLVLNEDEDLANTILINVQAVKEEVEETPEDIESSKTDETKGGEATDSEKEKEGSSKDSENSKTE